MKSADETADPVPANADLRLDYEQTLTTWRMLVDIRFKLLAFVPLITGAIVTVAGRSPSGASAVVAAVAAAVLFGVVVYDLRNSAFHDAAVHRAKELERLLGFNRLSDNGTGSGGLISERPRERYRLLGVQVWHDRGLFVIYSASAASLAGLFALGMLAGLQTAPNWRTPSVGVTVVAVFAFSLFLLHRYDKQVKRPRPPAQTSVSCRDVDHLLAEPEVHGRPSS